MNGKVFLQRRWNEFHFKKVKEKARNRYTPKLNVDLPISEIFGGITRSKSFYVSIRTSLGKLGREFSHISTRHENEEIQKLYNIYSRTVSRLLEVVNTIKEYNDSVIAWKTIGGLAKKADDLSWKLTVKLREEKEKTDKQQKPPETKNLHSPMERFNSDIHYLYEAENEIRYLEEFSRSITAKLSNSPFLLLTGIAGSGKTHLLCDVVENRLRESSLLPSVLVFGEYFHGKTDIWQQIRVQLGLSNKYDKTKILTRLNETGKKNSSRTLLIIDALNESQPLNFWQINLQRLFRDVKKYPHVALVVSIRSGFEDEVISSAMKKRLIQEEHHGFRFKEWEAVTKFFKEFSLPLPEIPLLMPEFQNPLFLLLFCKAFEKRKATKKQVFRGHEGATYIFENFVDSVSKRIEKRFGIEHGPGKNIWDKVIESIAAEMVTTSSGWIPEKKVIEIVSNAYPQIKQEDLLGDLERNLLIIKIPRYADDYKKVSGFDYRFPFQKFSDHLIGRFLFKKYRSSNKDAKRFFSKRTKIGKFLANSWHHGIVEAMSIQCPEQLKGLEFFEVAPYLQSYLLIETFIESLIWRRPDAFKKDLKQVLYFINKKVIQTDQYHRSLLNAFLSVAPIPNHPFNAYFLHKHLLHDTIPKRDSWWSTFLHYQYGEKGAVDRLIEWGWSDHDKTNIKDESIKLCSMALTWFFTTSNRFIRDKATKALVGLLNNKLAIIKEVMIEFQKVNDPYVLERLCAVAYGCMLRDKKNDDGAKVLGQWFYDNFFKKSKPPLHILTRDYAAGVVRLAVERSLIEVDLEKIKPPYGSKWSAKILSENSLRKKYYPEDFFKHKTEKTGYLSIWSSVMHDFGSLADFGNYTINPAVGHWSGRRLASGKVSRKKQLEIFEGNLTKKQLNLFKRLDPLYGINLSLIIPKLISFVPKEDEKIDENKLKEQKRKAEAVRSKKMRIFKESLSPHERKFFEKQLEPYLNGSNRIKDPLDRFDTKLAQRWIFNRVVKLGWNEGLHGSFDKDVNYYRLDRSEHKAERIGKKYQWIALHELLALIADNFEFKGEIWEDGSSVIYEGPWQLSIRDIDPSCMLREHQLDSTIVTPVFADYKLLYNAWKREITHKSWLKVDNDLPDPKAIVAPVDQKGVEWIMLEGHAEWQEDTPPEHEKYNIPTRTLWYVIKSYLIKKEDSRKLYNWLIKQDFGGRWMPESHEFYHVYLGEYPSSQAISSVRPESGWTNEKNFRGRDMPAQYMVTDDEYMSSGSSIDCSTENVIHVQLPAKWIVEEMNLKQMYTDGRFFDEHNKLVAFDPTLYSKNTPKCLLIQKDKLMQYLKDKEYEIFWAILGEKNIIGGGGVGQPLGWLVISGAYRLNKSGKFIGNMKCNFNKSG